MSSEKKTPLLEVTIEYIIRGVRDSIDRYFYGSVSEDYPIEKIGSCWWENTNETLMKVYKFYAPKKLVEFNYNETNRTIVCTQKETNEILYTKILPSTGYTS